MKIKIDTKKGAEAVSDFLQKTGDLSKKTINDIQQGAVSLSEKTKHDAYLRRLRKYNPLFPDVYNSPEFCIPNMIMIVDDAVRRGIDVCEGSIGWLGKQGNMEILYLYDEAVPVSKLQFVPAATCDSVYYVDSFDRHRFIRVDCIFSKAHEERLAELEYIAHSLGAKSCSVEISESHTEVTVSKKKASIKEQATVKGISASASESSENSASYRGVSQRSGVTTAQFEGSDTPKRPTLKWFEHDDNIRHLIDIRCDGGNTIKSKTLRLSGSSSATMSRKTACSIDQAIAKISSGGGSYAMEQKADQESQSVLIYIVEF